MLEPPQEEDQTLVRLLLATAAAQVVVLVVVRPTWYSARRLPLLGQPLTAATQHQTAERAVVVEEQLLPVVVRLLRITPQRSQSKQVLAALGQTE